MPDHPNTRHRRAILIDEEVFKRYYASNIHTTGEATVRTTPMLPMLSLALLLLALSPRCHAEANAGRPRTPQFPLKTDRTLLTDAQIEEARARLATYPAAKQIADKIISRADKWLEWSDEDLRALLPSAEVPRAFNVGTEGCPICGREIYQVGGTYPWLLDVKKPFTVTCPICKKEFPGNDFAAYYRSGFKDQSALAGDYADDGWGWQGPNDHYWFVGYANHWNWQNHYIPAVLYLARAYMLTGNPRYAHKTAVMLDRIAEIYPAMDYHTQSRYGRLQEAQGAHYGGKIVNLIWETGVLATFAEAYDAIWESIDADQALYTLTGRTGPEIRAHIEANILEEGIDAYFAHEIRGNFGMHQRALVYAALARQHGDTDAWLDGLFNDPGASPLHIGLNYALYNLVYRDGLPFETAPGYNFSWVANLTQIGETLRLTDRSLYEISKMRALYDGVLDMVNCGQFTPSVGDSGSVSGGTVARDAYIYQAAYRAYRDPRYARHLASFDATGEASFTRYEDLFLPRIESTAESPQPLHPRLLDGYGMAILCNRADSVSASLYYGYRGGHGHNDRLHFELFAHGHPIMPDLGYPDFMNAYVPGIYSWSKNTIAHNTVTVNASRGLGNQAGTVNLFATGPFARLIDVDAPETYPECQTYRRCLTMIDVNDGPSYFVDCFTVDGGSQQDYSLHGPPGTFTVHGGRWESQAKGTLAGEDVAIGELYDDPERNAPGYDGTYYGYAGSGFQHLFHVRRHKKGDWLAEWRHAENPSNGLRIRIPGAPGQQIILAEAQISPVKHKDLVTYLIDRRTGSDLKTTFTSIIEPFVDEPFIESVESLPLDEGSGTALAIHRAGGQTDVIICDPSQSLKRLERFSIASAAHTTVITFRNEREPSQVFFAGADAITVGERSITAAAMPEGRVCAVDPEARQIRIRLEKNPDGFEPATLVGAHCAFRECPPPHRPSHRGRRDHRGRSSSHHQRCSLCGPRPHRYRRRRPAHHHHRFPFRPGLSRHLCDGPPGLTALRHHHGRRRGYSSLRAAARRTPLQAGGGCLDRQHRPR